MSNTKTINDPAAGFSVVYRQVKYGEFREARKDPDNMDQWIVDNVLVCVTRLERDGKTATLGEVLYDEEDGIDKLDDLEMDEVVAIVELAGRGLSGKR